MPPISLMKSHQHMPGLAAGRTWLPTQPIAPSNPPDDIAFHGCAMQILEQHDRNERSLLCAPIAAVLTAPPLKVKACPVSRVTPVQTALRNCTGDEGGPFGFGDQVADSKPPQAA